MTYPLEERQRALAIYVEDGPAAAYKATGIHKRTIMAWAREEGLTFRTLVPCGTKAAYVRHLRRGETTCDACREANREATYAAVADLKRRAANGEIAIPHGTTVGYSYRGCQCDACKKANTRHHAPYARAWRERQKAKAAS